MAKWLLIGYLISFAVMPFVLLSKKRPIATLAWIWGLLLFPYLGVLLYLTIGTNRMHRRKLRRYVRRAFSSSGVQKRDCLPPHGDSPACSLLQTLAFINKIPVSSLQSARVLIDAHTFYPALLERIQSARHHIHVEFFIWRNDEEGLRFRDALVDAAKRGVVVRVLLDEFGCFGLRASFFDPLVRAGGKFSWFYSLPFNRKFRFMNLRNHRKLQIIDGTCAFVGGMNMGSEHMGGERHASIWRDVQIEVQGAAVCHLQEVFATDWLFATKEQIEGEGYYQPSEPGPHLCQIVAGGPDLPREPVPKSLVAILNSAKKRVWISTGYFVPDGTLLCALQICAARGVDVRLIISLVTDHRYLVEVGRSYYEDLLAFGVRIFEYSKGVNHAKTILMDDDWLSVGSANFDNRSMRLNFELNLFLHCPGQVPALAAMLEQDFSGSAEITMETIAQRSFLRRMGMSALRPLAPLL